jgi:glutathione S-transferase
MSDSPCNPQHQLLGLYDSPFVRRVAITLQLYGIAYEHLSLSVFRHMDTMRAINPLFKVPMLTLPNGEKLHESAYLLDYLDELASEAGPLAADPAQWPRAAAGAAAHRPGDDRDRESGGARI